MALATVVIVAHLCPLEVAAADAPQDRVLVMYFHRTDRCTTCVTMGSYSEEAVKTGFAEEVKGGAIQSTVRVTVEIEGEDRPGCIAETCSLYFPKK